MVLIRTNKFLLKINQEFFQPRGLYCLVMTCKPESPNQVYETVDLKATINTAMTSYNSSFTNKFKYSDGTTYSDFAFLEAAPLIFPTLDVLCESNSEEAVKLRDKMKKKASFVSSYYDKRAVARYVRFSPSATSASIPSRSECLLTTTSVQAGKHPDSLLAQQVEKPKFTSRYADPNHPANSGSLIALVTGGHINPPPMQRGGLAGRGAGFGRGAMMGAPDQWSGLGRGLGVGLGRGIENTGMGMLLGAVLNRGNKQNQQQQQYGQQEQQQFAQR